MRRGRLRALALGAAGAVALAGAALAQDSPHPSLEAGGPSSLPAGDATIRGVVVDAEHPGDTAGLPVALYALQPDGTPGIGGTETADDGSFSFAGLSNDPGIVYLVGVRYALVPFGERTAFAPGQREIDLALAVTRPTADTSRVRVVSTTLRLESRGRRLAIVETHELVNAGDAPVYVPEAERADREAPFRAGLPRQATRFQAGTFGTEEGFEQSGSEVSYWGPIYGGEQELRFGYELPVPADAAVVSFEKAFPAGVERVRVRAREQGPKLESPDLAQADPVEEEGVRLQSLEGGILAPGAVVRLAARVPETRSDPAALRLGRADVAVELDDTYLEVTQTQSLTVTGGAHLAGSHAEPLLRFDVPLRAELVGVSADAERLGVQVIETPPAPGVALLGPLGPGTHELAFRYRLPAEDGAATLDLRFPMTVPTLLLRAADTGLVIESDRLHRLRPQAMGTRMWMLREAFRVEPDEQLRIRFEALEQTGPSQIAGVAFLVAASAFVLFFVVTPLRGPAEGEMAPDAERSGPAHERDLVYATIRDLEHDFETGKVAEEDFTRTRDELRVRAVELMREELRPAAPVRAVATPATPTGPFCPTCGDRVDPSWRFCSHCGGALQPTERSGSEPAR